MNKEEAYKRIKRILERINSEENREVYGASRNNSGETVARASISVVHDAFNITQDLKTAAEKKAVKKAKRKGFKYEMRVNENIAIGLLKEKFISLMLEEDDGKKEEIFLQNSHGDTELKRTRRGLRTRTPCSLLPEGKRNLCELRVCQDFFSRAR